MSLAYRTRKHELSRALCLAAAFLFIHSMAGYAQTEPLPPDARPIEVKSELVVLPVRVLDSNGDFVTGLKLDDFRVYVDGHLQRVSLFQQEDTPVTVGLVVDHSRSMGTKLAGVTAAISDFAKSSNPQDDMFVVDFNDKVSLELPGGNPFTHDPTELAKALSAVSARGTTALYDAVNEGLKHLQLDPRNKKALIIVSDGGDDASQHKYADVLALARQSQVVIYCIGLIDDSSADQDPRVLQRFSDDTGGIAFFPKPNESVTKVSEQIARDLREQYTLGFVPDETRNDRVFRKVSVKVTAPGKGKIRVRTRRGYIDADKSGTNGQSAP